MKRSLPIGFLLRFAFPAIWIPLSAAIVCILLSTAFPRVVLAEKKSPILTRIEQATATSQRPKIDSVQPVIEKTIRARERYQGGAFRVLARKNHIGRYPCNSCHNGRPVTARDGKELTHGDVILRHGRKGVLSCIDCHDEKDRNFLISQKGDKIDFDHSYQLCGQCHFRQKSDWLGGAHGKRVGYWAGERVIYNCTTCHNPHSPRFAKRFPATYSPPSP